MLTHWSMPLYGTTATSCASDSEPSAGMPGQAMHTRSSRLPPIWPKFLSEDHSRPVHSGPVRAHRPAASPLCLIRQLGVRQLEHYWPGLLEVEGGRMRPIQRSPEIDLAAREHRAVEADLAAREHRAVEADFAARERSAVADPATGELR